MFNPSSSKGSGPTESWAPPAARSRLNSTIRLPKQAKVFSPLHPTIYPFLVAPLVAGGKVSAPDRPEAAAGVDAEFCGLVQALGAEATLDKRRLTVRCKRRLAPFTLPAPTADGSVLLLLGLAVLATDRAMAPSQVTGLGPYDRRNPGVLQSMMNQVTALGGWAATTGDGIEFRPTPLAWGTWDAAGHPGMAMLGAVLSLRIPGLRISGADELFRIHPRFDVQWRYMVDAGGRTRDTTGDSADGMQALGELGGDVVVRGGLGVARGAGKVLGGIVRGISDIVD